MRLDALHIVPECLSPTPGALVWLSVLTHHQQSPNVYPTSQARQDVLREARWKENEYSYQFFSIYPDEAVHTFYFLPIPLTRHSLACYGVESRCTSAPHVLLKSGK